MLETPAASSMFMWMRFADSDASTPPPAPGTPSGGADARGFGDEVHDTLAAVLPWGVSILLHVGVILLAFFVAWSTYVEPEDEEVVIPSLSYTPTPQPMQFETQQVERRIQERSLQPIEVRQPTEAIEFEPVGVGDLADLEPPPEAEPFDDLAGEDQRFAVRFFVRGNARKVAFLIDASGSLIADLPFVIDHLRETIAGLSEPQEFTVLLFQADQVIESPPPGLKRASPRNKDAVLQWLADKDYISGGSSDPVVAIRRALRYRPQLLFLLSDNLTNAGKGPYEVPQWRLIEEIEQANLGNTKIKTIQFLHEDPLEHTPGREGTMKRIARLFGAGENGNLNEWYTFISERDLNIQ